MSRDLLDGSRWLKRAVWWVAGYGATVLPLPLSRLVAHAVGDLMWLVDARGRRTVTRNLLPVVPSAEARARVARAMYRACTAQVLFTLRLGTVSPATVSPAAVLPATALKTLGELRLVGPWHALPARGAVVIATLHADWDALLLALTATGLLAEVAVAALPAGDAAVDRQLAALRAAAGAATIPWERAAGGCLRELRAGRAVGVLADRAYSAAAIEVRVGSERLRLPAGPLELARRTGCPFMPMACVRMTGRTLLVCTHPLDPVRDGMDACVRAWARFQLRVLAANPSRWVAFHPVWAARTAADLSGA